jgi:hypothetical protein
MACAFARLVVGPQAEAQAIQQATHQLLAGGEALLGQRRRQTTLALADPQQGSFGITADRRLHQLVQGFRHSRAAMAVDNPGRGPAGLRELAGGRLPSRSPTPVTERPPLPERALTPVERTTLRLRRARALDGPREHTIRHATATLDVLARGARSPARLPSGQTSGNDPASVSVRSVTADRQVATAWSVYCDEDSDNFRIIDPGNFRVLA